jgi:hypothetical protein
MSNNDISIKNRGYKPQYCHYFYKNNDSIVYVLVKKIYSTVTDFARLRG